MAHQLLTSLNQEWAALNEEAQPELRHWTERFSVLGGCRRPDDLLIRIAARPDETLAALVLLGRDGSALARRTVLQTMLGKMVRLAVADPDSTLDDYVAALWCEILAYPLERRPTSIAANLALDTRKAVRRDACRRASTDPVVSPEDGLPSPRLPSPRLSSPELSAPGVLIAARDLGLIDESTRRLLHAVYADGCSGREVAARSQLSYTTVRFRCSQAVRRLADNASELARAA